MELSWKLCPFCDHALEGPSGAAATVAPAPKGAVQRPATPKAACPACAEEVERDWKICPFCDHELHFAKTPVAAAVPPSSKGPSASAQGSKATPTSATITKAATPARPTVAAAPPAPKDPAAATSARMAKIQHSLERAEAAGKARKDVRNFLTLAQRNIASGKLDKAADYLDKAEKALEQP